MTFWVSLIWGDSFFKYLTQVFLIYSIGPHLDNFYLIYCFAFLTPPNNGEPSIGQVQHINSVLWASNAISRIRLYTYVLVIEFHYSGKLKYFCRPLILHSAQLRKSIFSCMSFLSQVN